MLIFISTKTVFYRFEINSFIETMCYGVEEPSTINQLITQSTSQLIN